jgi:hypothetical protein
MRSRPYRNDRIIIAIRDLYFFGDSSLVVRFGELFPLCQNEDGSTSREVPIPMVALVSTAVSHAFVALHKQRVD